MEGLVNWQALEKMTGWATRTSDEEATRWDHGADGWQKRILFEKDFTQRQVEAMTRITKEDTVLDACCGTGRLTIPLAYRAKHVYGVDAGENMLAYCSRNAVEAGLQNITLKRIPNWHTCEPGKEIPIADIAVACISPAQADIVKLSRCARKYCYSLSFSTPIAYRHVMAELFEGVSDKWENVRQEKNRPIPERFLGLNVPFNLLYDLGANPTVGYADGGWEYEAETKDKIYRFLADFGTVPPESEERFRANCDKRIVPLENGRFRYITKTQMYVLGWDPGELKIDR